MVKGANAPPAVEPARPAKDAPGSSPNHRNSPLGPRAPCQICCTESASGSLKQVPSVGAPGLPQMSACGSNGHLRGSLMTPSTTPSIASHDLIAAAVTALNLAGEIGAPRLRFITTSGQSSAG